MTKQHDHNQTTTPHRLANRRRRQSPARTRPNPAGLILPSPVFPLKSEEPHSIFSAPSSESGEPAGPPTPSSLIGPVNGIDDA